MVKYKCGRKKNEQKKIIIVCGKLLLFGIIPVHIEKAAIIKTVFKCNTPIRLDVSGIRCHNESICNDGVRYVLRNYVK